MDAIYSRRSIRRYVAKPVEPEKIEAVISAASYAPSATNSQPWEFVIVDDRELLEKIQKIHPYSKMLSEAAAAIVVCGDLTRYRPGMNSGFYLVDCAAAIQNLLLEAHELGLGTCWLGVAPNERTMKDVGEIIGAPENIVVHSMIAIGYPAEEPEARPRKPFEIRHNKFD